MSKLAGKIVIGIGGVIAAAAIIAGCASAGSEDASPSGTIAPAQAVAPVAAPSPTGPCTTKACIVSDAETLKGDVAKDNSVMTKVTCTQSTVKQVVPGTYTVHCVASYSDGAKYHGIASVLTAKEEVDWEATSAISYGDGQ